MDFETGLMSQHSYVGGLMMFLSSECSSNTIGVPLTDKPELNLSSLDRGVATS